MAIRTKELERTEFGDFQTPTELAASAASVVFNLGFKPKTIIEPTCGRGAFVLAAAAIFPEAEVIGADINTEYISDLNKYTENLPNVSVFAGDFFNTDWKLHLSNSKGPVLILGNYPWVTGSVLGSIGSTNLPLKSNVMGFSGMEALTGKSNFDISEWMLMQNLIWLKGGKGAIAMLCKTSVARKILKYVWKNAVPVSDARIYRIDTKKHFNAAVDACFFFLNLSGAAGTMQCAVYPDLTESKPCTFLGFENNTVIPNLLNFRRMKLLFGNDANYVWRSGIKHDCARVMELNSEGPNLKNGLGEYVDIEAHYLYPMLKSSDVAGEKTNRLKYMLVTQQFVGEPTGKIESTAPKTWSYLTKHMVSFELRGSSIYNGKPDFSIFGVGAYTFKPWKVAISGFYKKLNFSVIGPVAGRPVVFDDTVYFLGCESENQAVFIAGLLNSYESKVFFDSLIFWDEKRPITIELLRKLNLRTLATLFGLADEFDQYASVVRANEIPFGQLR